MKKIFILCLIFLSALSAAYADEQNNKVIDTTTILKELREKERNLNIREADLWLKPENTIVAIDTAVAIFSRMTPNVAGKLLNELGKSNPEYASKMAERLTYQPVFGDDKRKPQ